MITNNQDIVSLYSEGPPDPYSNEVDPNLASFLALTALSANSVVLLIGFENWQMVQAVVSRCRFVVWLAPINCFEQSEVGMSKNILRLCAGTNAFPFQDSVFDLVLINLDRTAANWGKPASQSPGCVRALVKIKKSLKQGGVAIVLLDYMSLEFCGKWPVIGKFKKSREMSLFGKIFQAAVGSIFSFNIQKNLKAAGFKNIEKNLLYPDSTRPFEICPSSNKILKKFFLKSKIDGAVRQMAFCTFRIKHFLATLGYDEIFASSFLFFSTVQEPNNTNVHLEGVAIKYVEEFLGKDLAYSNELLLKTSSKQNKIIIIVWLVNAKEPFAIVKIGYQGHKLPSTIIKEFSILKSVKKITMASECSVSEVIPDPIGHKIDNCFELSLESPVKGIPLDQFVMLLRNSDHITKTIHTYEACCQFASRLHSALSVRSSETVSFTTDCRRLSVPSFLNRENPILDRLETLAKSGRIFYKGLMHGDFSSVNIYVNPSGTVSGIIDWEHCAKWYPFLFDHLSLTLSLFVMVPYQAVPRECEAAFKRFFSTEDSLSSSVINILLNSFPLSVEERNSYFVFCVLAFLLIKYDRYTQYENAKMMKLYEVFILWWIKKMEEGKNRLFITESALAK